MTQAADIATLPAIAMRTCCACEKAKPQTVFVKAENWPSPEEPLCRKCWNEQEERVKDTQRALETLTPTQLLGLYEDTETRLLKGMSSRKIQLAPLKDLTIGVKNLRMNIQLLKEMPTQIVGQGQRESLLAMAKLIQAERERRAKTVEVLPA